MELNSGFQEVNDWRTGWRDRTEMVVIIEAA
jgi:hypothetical protein